MQQGQQDGVIKLGMLLDKSREELTEDEQRCLLTWFYAHDKNEEAQPKDYEEMARILKTPTEKLTHHEKAYLEGFYSALGIFHAVCR